MCERFRGPVIGNGSPPGTCRRFERYHNASDRALFAPGRLTNAQLRGEFRAVGEDVFIVTFTALGAEVAVDMRCCSLEHRRDQSSRVDVVRALASS